LSSNWIHLGPTLDPFARVGQHAPGVIDLKGACPGVGLNVLAILENEKAVALNRCVKKSRAGLNGSLGELPDGQRTPGSEAHLGFAESGAEGLRHKIAEINHAGLVARRVQVREVIADDVYRG
jgi:hypothetical protein